MPANAPPTTDHDVLIDLRRIFLSFIENSAKDASEKDKKIDALQAFVTRSFENLAKDMCDDRARTTNLEKDIIRMQGGMTALGTDLAVQRTTIQNQFADFKREQDDLKRRVGSVEEDVKTKLPKEIDDSSDETQKATDERLKAEKAERREELIKWITIVGGVAAFIGWLIGATVG